VIWRNITDTIIRTEACGVTIEVSKMPDGGYMLTVSRVVEGKTHSGAGRYTTLDRAKDAALATMRDHVVAARGDAENTICEASRWLRANGGEP